MWRCRRNKMAPHLTRDELDYMFEEAAKGTPVKKIHEKLTRWRAKSKQTAPCLMRFLRALLGRTYRRSKKETRGRKRSITRHLVHKMNSTRKRLQKKADGEREIRWEDIRRAARAPKVHPVGSAGCWISDFGPAAVGCSILNQC